MNKEHTGLCQHWRGLNLTQKHLKNPYKQQRSLFMVSLGQNLEMAQSKGENIISDRTTNILSFMDLSLLPEVFLESQSYNTTDLITART